MAAHAEEADDDDGGAPARSSQGYLPDIHKSSNHMASSQESLSRLKSLTGTPEAGGAPDLKARGKSQDHIASGYIRASSPVRTPGKAGAHAAERNHQQLLNQSDSAIA